MFSQKEFHFYYDRSICDVLHCQSSQRFFFSLSEKINFLFHSEYTHKHIYYTIIHIIKLCVCVCKKFYIERWYSFFFFLIRLFFLSCVRSQLLLRFGFMWCFLSLSVNSPTRQNTEVNSVFQPRLILIQSMSSSCFTVSFSFYFSFCLLFLFDEMPK